MVTHLLQVERRTAKAHRPKTNAMPLNHATNGESGELTGKRHRLSDRSMDPRRKPLCAGRQTLRSRGISRPVNCGTCLNVGVNRLDKNELHLLDWLWICRIQASCTTIKAKRAASEMDSVMEFVLSRAILLASSSLAGRRQAREPARELVR